MSTHESESDIQSVFNSDNLSVTVTKNLHCQVKLDIKIIPHAVEAAYHKAIKNVNKEVTVPGFRKGRAPEALIVDRYPSVIHKEFVDLVLKTAFSEAIHLTQLHPLKDGHMERPVVHECSLEKGAHFTIEFEIRPIIPSIKIEDLQLKKVSLPPITEQDRQNALQNLLLQFATYDPIEDRPVQENDFVTVSVTILEDPPREVIHHQRTQVNAMGLPIWLRQKVINLRVGESAEGMTEQDSNLSEPDPNFQSLPFRVTVHAIWLGHLPSVDEELAKRVGLQSVEELYQKIDERLEQELQEETFRTESHLLEQLLIERYPIDLPQSYIDANKEARVKEYLLQLEKQGQTYSKEDHIRMEESIEQNVIFHLQLFFLLRKIATDYNITVDHQDISEELKRQIALISSGHNNIDFQDREKLTQQLHNLALDRKIKQFLLNKIEREE